MRRWIAPFILLGLGGGLVLWGLHERDLASEAERWLTTQGNVVSSEVVPRSPASHSDVAAVVYTYEVNDRVYRSRQISRARRFSTPYKTVSKYRPGKEVTVWYNPADPASAALEPSAWSGGKFLLAIGCALLGLAALAILGLVAVRSERAPSRE